MLGVENLHVWCQKCPMSREQMELRGEFPCRLHGCWEGWFGLSPCWCRKGNLSLWRRKGARGVKLSRTQGDGLSTKVSRRLFEILQTLLRRCPSGDALGGVCGSSPAGRCSARVRVGRATLLRVRGQQPRCRRWVRAGGSGGSTRRGYFDSCFISLAPAGLRTPSFWGGCRDPGSIITPAGSGREIYIPGREQP